MPTVEATDPSEDANAAAKPDAETSQTTATWKKKSPNGSSKKAGNGAKPAASPAKGGDKKKPEPTLLHDFLRGRPSASRPTASRPRRKSSGMAGAEMKASAVNKLTPPAKVKNRVLEWQKAARGAGAPEVFDIEEPVLAKLDDTLKTPSRSQSAGPRKKEESTAAAAPPEEKSTPVPTAPPVTVVNPKATTARKAKKATLETSMPPTARGAQMKRVVSDTHWMNKAAAAKKEAPKAVTKDPIFNLLLNSGVVKKAATTKPSLPKAAESKTMPKKLPKDFTETNWANPPAERKIRDWVQRNEEESAHGQEADPEAVEAFKEAVKEARRSRNSSRSPAKVDVPRAFTVTDDIRKPSPGLKERASREDAEKSRPTSGYKKPVLKCERTRRVRAARPEEIAAALGLPPPGCKSPKQRRDFDKRYEEKDDRRRLPSYGTSRDAGRDRAYDDNDLSSLTETSVYYDRPYASKPTTPRGPAEPSRDRGSSDHYDNARHSSSYSREAPCRQASKPKPRKPREETTIVTESTLSSLTSDSEDTMSDTASVRRDDMKREGKTSLRAGEKSLSEIPVGYSAFSVLDLSSNGTPRTRPANTPQRKASIGLPNVLKRVYNEGMKIMQDTVDPPRIVIKNPPNIESWLNGTTDPFLDDPTKRPSDSQRRPKSQDGPKRERSQTYKRPTARNDSPSRESTPTRTYSRSKSSARDRDTGRDSRDHSRKSSFTETVIPGSTVLDRGHESFAGLKRRPARRETSSPFTERKSARDLRIRQPVRDLDSYADSLVRDSGRGSSNQPRSQDHMRVQSMGPLPEVSRHSPRPRSLEDVKASHQSVNEKNNGLDKTERPEITRPTRLRRIPSTGPTTGAPRRHEPLSVSKLEVSIKRSHGQPLRYQSNKILEGSGLKRRLTKHSDLMSMLSLPDIDPKIQRGGSIVSARSIRTKRAPPNSKDVRLILSEVRADEEKYFRELRTLVDGVIPVLLSSVLSCPNSMTVPRSSESTDSENAATTKSVVEMGEALNLLKDIHSQILLNSSEELITWLLSAHAAYEQYLNAWRLGFDDIIVNLAPAAEADDNNNNTKDPMACCGVAKRNQETETVDVAYLLRRPLERVKYLEKAAKGLNAANPTDSTKQALMAFKYLVELLNRRRKEEKARRQDTLANNTDVSRVRDLQTLSPAENVRIDKSKQVKAKDFFGFSLAHSNGQRLACEVEIIIRDSRKGSLDGDVLICEVDDSGSNQWLLFRPIEIGYISAQYGGTKKDLIVTVRGWTQGKEWVETFSLRAETVGIAEDFHDMIGSNPGSPSKDRPRLMFGSSLSLSGNESSIPITPRSAMMHGALAEAGKDHPIRASSLNAEEKSRQPRRSVWVNDIGTDHVYDKDSDAFRAKSPMKSRTSMSQAIRPPSSCSRPQSNEGETLARPQTKRRPSSPLKSEYNPAGLAQAPTQVSTQYTDSDSYDSYSESELTESDTEVSPEPTLDSVQPSQDSTPRSTPPPEHYCHKFAAHISCWLQDKGQFLDLHKDICAVRVMPGSVKIFVMDATHSAPYQDDDDKQPLIELELTPLSVLAQRTGLDVEVRAAVLETSQLKASNCIRLRSTDTISCRALYRRLEQARKDNIVYNTLEQERIISGYGQRQEETMEEFEGRRSWFGRKKSYRASALAPTVESSGSKFSFKNAFTALDRFKMNNRSFDIEKSSMKSGDIFGRNRGSRASSQYAAEDSLSNGFTPPLTAYNPSSVTSGGGESGQFDTTSMRIRLYFLVKATDWYDCGEYIIAITQPPPWMKPKSTLYDGFQRRVTLTEFQEETVADKITKRFSTRPQEKIANVAWDEVMGAKCFLRQGKKGILMFTWQALTSKNGVVGQAPDEGGVCGRQQKYMIYSERTAQSRFIYALLGAGGGGLDT